MKVMSMVNGESGEKQNFEGFGIFKAARNNQNKIY